MDIRKWIILAGNIIVVFCDSQNVSADIVSHPAVQHRGTTESGMLALVWYVMTFGALIIFFTFLSCSGGLCRRLPPSQSSLPVLTPMSDRKQTPPEKPPAYELFAPPAYETVVKGADLNGKNKGPECTVFTIS
ncbi:uncharacterized protein LOC113363597 [Ctenocephalides felis]|uniref:uncharacterized protein LOC113363597 n=1 Tax=Ctenocephalides felis TaxID=7515 RepID=UPI000E6E2EB8|nr:uncharacterized protein LOC113363597 [Ctenocephalides felis]